MKNRILWASGLALLLIGCLGMLGCGGPAAPDAVVSSPVPSPSPTPTPVPFPTLVAGVITGHVRGNGEGDNANPWHVNQRVDLFYQWICRDDDTGEAKSCKEQPITVAWAVVPPCHLEGSQNLPANTLKCDEPGIAIVNANAVTPDGRTVNAAFNGVVIQ